VEGPKGEDSNQLFGPTQGTCRRLGLGEMVRGKAFRCTLYHLRAELKKTQKKVLKRIGPKGEKIKLYKSTRLTGGFQISQGRFNGGGTSQHVLDRVGEKFPGRASCGGGEGLSQLLKISLHWGVEGLLQAEGGVEEG